MTIILDFWKAYDCLQDEGYEHLKVNHSFHFKDPDTGAHSNSMESLWHAAKVSFPSSGRIKAHIPGNLAGYMFEKRCDGMGLDRAVEFLTLAGLLYRDSDEPVDEVLDDDVDLG
uniref:Transposase n=1 Tax=Romanomermis culicivorax TaxID=13658 RepID=A0A915IQ30_ROMCU